MEDLRVKNNCSSAGTNNMAVTKSEEIDLLSYLRVICKYYKMILAIVFFVSVASVIYSLALPKTYKADATIMAISPGGGNALASLASQLGSLSGFAAIAGRSGPDGGERLVAMLKSRTLAENVINRENLLPYMFSDLWDAKNGKWKTDDPKMKPSMSKAVELLKKTILITNNIKSQTIEISGVFDTPELAAKIVNAYLDELQDFLLNRSFSTAKRNRIFIGEQLEQNKIELLESSKEIGNFYRGNRFLNVESKMNVNIPMHESSVGDVDMGPTINKEAQEMQRLLSKKADIDEKIAEAKLIKDVPQQVYVNYLMLKSELLAKVNALLATQYEMSKIDEAKEELYFQVVDRAVPPELKFGPKRAQICISSFIVSLVFSVFLVFLRNHLGRIGLAHYE